ncbi:kinase-like domain-containing protein [Rhizophagus clarus]|nr:kinase-like domain-containing protein [Rhizophagus clarus]
MHDLAKYYETGKGIEKNLEKSFYWHKKAVENGNKHAIICLVGHYKYGIGTDKDLEKAFYWCQKSAENSNEEAQCILASLYFKGIGTEKDLKKAFYWFQKSAENGYKKAQHNLALSYYLGLGTEKDYERAVYWFQKSAENGDYKAMDDLAYCYEYGNGIEKDLKKAFDLCQKAAENGIMSAMIHLATFYRIGKATEKNLKKTLYWYQEATKIARNDPEIKSMPCVHELMLNRKVKLIEPLKRFIIESEEENYNKCSECHMKRRPSKKNNQICIICYQAKLLYNPSGNDIINEFIKYTQTDFVQETSRMRFISYDRFKNKEFIRGGGFSNIYKAIWIDGPHSWNEEKEDFEYKNPNVIVALKQLNNSEMISFEELKELLMIYIANLNNFFDSLLYLNEYYGITQDPNTKDFIIIMKYYKFDLRNYITKNKDFYNIKWSKKLKILRSIAEGLDHLHDQNIIHRDLHSGNILCENDDDVIISDLGISKSSMESANDKKRYGIIPYMAPEILKGKDYTTLSDIYSFGMIMWELMTGSLPFEDRTQDNGLASKICYDGLRPSKTTNAPKGYIELMEKCWDSDPVKRPNANAINETLYNILIDEINNPTEIIKPSDITPTDNPKNKQLGITFSSEELEPLYPIINKAEVEYRTEESYKTKANEFDI